MELKMELELERSRRRIAVNKTQVAVNAVMFLFTISCIFPLLWLIYSSLKTQPEFANSIMALPRTLHFENYAEAIKLTHMFQLAWNSARVTVISVIGIVFISFVTGYITARLDFKGKRLMVVYYLFGLLVPIHALLVPVYLLFKNTGLADQWYTLIIPYIAFNLSVPIMLVNGYITAIPREIEEASAIDGLGFSGTMFKIIMPIAVPVLTTVAILQFFACWNEFSFALVLLKDESLRTVPLGMSYFKSQYSTNYPQLMAGMVLSMLPVTLLYFTFSSRIISSVMAGSVKG
ncbi:carbohydrate ABC transporter permease [Paenibacillus sp. HN-1]|uniref:carbohydrate ABC transporter permease n=1 Tax=Paenibacillus TaxID=44249 RepID=UPI001CA8D767|nr:MULTISPECIES: carbohydrate ABC transporter permease [Paenibacillus]MBY9079472.1 carbohydrate ABC transporter permease [Paenibacillus sp. CGMCC 1.18879]MBY9085561.1 carbohydrate ABC transporter permease [Paenibacillus sinensis]